MRDVAQFDWRGVAACPAQGGRVISEDCWNHHHTICTRSACDCLCHVKGHRCRKVEQPEQLTINIAAVGTVKV